MEPKACVCGHSEEEHGRVPEFPGSMECTADDCDCIAYEADDFEDDTEGKGTMNDVMRRAIEYVRNTGGNATIAVFDDDHEPVGPMLRKDIMPKYVIEGKDGYLELTGLGRLAVADGGGEHGSGG